MTAREKYLDHTLVKSDLAKVDAHVIAPEEYEDLPEWTEEMFAEADYYPVSYTHLTLPTILLV